MIPAAGQPGGRRPAPRPAEGRGRRVWCLTQLIPPSLKKTTPKKIFYIYVK